MGVKSRGNYSVLHEEAGLSACGYEVMLRTLYQVFTLQEKMVEAEQWER
jgi:hypothetical protein